MPKRANEPDEALGPAVDGLADGGYLAFASPEPEPAEAEEPPISDEEPGEEETGIVLLCGDGELARETSALAASCGFEIRQALLAGEKPLDDATVYHLGDDMTDFIEDCAIDRDYFICVFWDDAEYCETALAQCLASDARYIGLWANRDKRNEIFAQLREDGAPDAELAAICSPMGLNIGAVNPQQAAVGIVGELLAARAGTLKRLRHEE